MLATWRSVVPQPICGKSVKPHPYAWLHNESNRHWQYHDTARSAGSATNLGEWYRRCPRDDISTVITPCISPPFSPSSRRSPATSASPTSSSASSPYGMHWTPSRNRIGGALMGRNSCSTMAPLSPPARRTTATCWPAPSRTSCRASGACAAIRSNGASAGTAMACRSKAWPRRNSAGRALPRSVTAAWRSSMRPAARWSRPMSANGARPCAAWAAGSISIMTTRPWTRRSWNRCGGSSSSFGMRGTRMDGRGYTKPTASCRIRGN